MSQQSQTIAFLATGDEILSGDILNINSQQMALQLTELGLTVGNHLSCSDDENDLVQAMQFLLNKHQVLIITGGLGPTSDDRTRFALAKTLNRELILDESSWQAIEDRLTSYGFDVPDNNKQQALFPKGAVILPNKNGTAAGCHIKTDSKQIFMLPGPPAECLPIFEEHILPVLNQSIKGEREVLYKWRLFAVSEGHIAPQLEALLHGTNISPAYRIDYPYLEFKIRLKPSDPNKHSLLQKIEDFIKPHLLADATEKATSCLKKILASNSTQRSIRLIDNATGGLLESLIHRPSTHQALNNTEQDNIITVTLEGLSAYWQQDLSKQTSSLKITIHQNGSEKSQESDIPNRANRALLFAVEVAAKYIIDNYYNDMAC